MGNAAQGSLETCLGPYQLALKPATERLGKALHFGKRIISFLDGSKDTCSVSAAWWLLSKSMREALSYDIRIIPRTRLQEILTLHETALREVVTKILGKELSNLDWRRMQLPGPLGGASLRLPSSSADAAFLATWVATSAKIRVLCAELGRPTATDVAKSDALAARERLCEAGVKVDAPTGKVEFSEAAAHVYSSSPWSLDMPSSELLGYTPSRSDAANGCNSRTHSRVMRGLEALEANRVYEAMDCEFQREVFLSSGGRQAGKVWSQPPET